MNGLRLSCSRFSRAAGSWLVRGRRSSGSGSSGRSSGLLASVSVLLGCLLVSSVWASPYAAALPCESQPAGCPSTLDGLTSIPNDPTWTTSIDPEAVASFHATATPMTETSTPIATTAAPSPDLTRQEVVMPRSEVPVERVEVQLSQDWEDLRGFVILGGLVGLLLLTVTAVGAWRR